ncbi:MAG: Maf family protein [Candidatus Hydrogenedentes bacterium]|nr:Maf family protein [Candidatus Hydrogenedentota bacterium]
MEDCGLPLVLASASPRRRALLASLGVEFEVFQSGVKEIDEGDSPSAIVERNALLKCEDVAKKVNYPAVIISADTLVFLEGEVLSKPRDLDDAKRILNLLSGNTHQVVTGIAVINTADSKRVLGSEITDVTFRPLSNEEVEIFVNVVCPLDRAGAYTVDGPGSLLVSRYDGCFYNVLGLPLVKLDKLLRKVGVNLFSRIRKEHASFL